MNNSPSLVAKLDLFVWVVVGSGQHKSKMIVMHKVTTAAGRYDVGETHTNAGTVSNNGPRVYLASE